MAGRTDGARLCEALLLSVVLVTPLVVQGRETSSLLWELGHFSKGHTPGAPSGYTAWGRNALELVLGTQRGEIRAVVVEGPYHPWI